ncbi:MAG TPA: hypothetical protein VGL81_14000 [Polyangiaceae bacterium]|jgi:alpha-tubulin suppressor-like RCC1 family protein
MSRHAHKGAMAMATCTLAAIACGINATVLRSESVPADAGDDAPSFPGVDASAAAGVFAGQSSTCAISSGAAFCWGDNANGEVGAGDEQAHLEPVAVDTNSRLTTAAVGEVHACAIRAPDASVLCWGGNTNGQLGVGDGADRPTPQIVSLPFPAVSITTGYQHTCAILFDGSLWCWGDNDEGELGLNDAYGSPNQPVPVRVGMAVDWMAVSGGQGHTCGIRAPGTMWCWGRNNQYQLGLGTVQPDQLRAPTQVGQLTDWTSLDVGQDQACALRADGSLWCWGDGTNGNLAQPAAALPTPTQIGVDTDWATLSTDEFSTCAIKRDGVLYCWGRNVEGQLGTGDTQERTSPTATGSGDVFQSVSVGRFHTCAGTTLLQVQCTGKNDSGQLGLGDTNERDVFTPVTLPTSQ